MIEHTTGAIVLTAEFFNPSIFTETWLAKNDILDASRLVGPRVFSPQIAQFQTGEMQIIVIAPKMEISCQIPGVVEGWKESISFAAKVIETLPHTPYKALGLNYGYFVSPPAASDFHDYDRTLFGTGECALLAEFQEPDALFGRYFSKDFGSARLKLDIKPVKAGPENKDMIFFDFNFHHDLSPTDPSERAKELLRLVATWDRLREYSEMLTKKVTGAKE